MKTKTNQKNNKNNIYNNNDEWVEIPTRDLKVGNNRILCPSGLNATNYFRSGRKIKIVKNNATDWEDGIIYSVDPYGFRVWGVSLSPTDILNQVSVALTDVPYGGPYFYPFDLKTKEGFKILKINQNNKLMVIGNRVDVYLDLEFMIRPGKFKPIGLPTLLPISDGVSAMNFFDSVFMGLAYNVTDNIEHTMYIQINGDDLRSYGYAKEYAWLYLDKHPKSKYLSGIKWQPGNVYRIVGNYYYYLI